MGMRQLMGYIINFSITNLTPNVSLVCKQTKISLSHKELIQGEIPPINGNMKQTDFCICAESEGFKK